MLFFESLITHDESEDDYQCAQEFQLDDDLSRPKDFVFPNHYLTFLDDGDDNALLDVLFDLDSVSSRLIE